MEPKFLRIVYAAEFLLALIAVFTVWSQVGGQGHLDSMAWYLKLSLGLAMAYAIVRATSAAAGHVRGWNGKTLRWIGILALLAAVAGVITYFYHVYEPSDEEDDQPTSRTGLLSYHSEDRPGGLSYCVSSMCNCARLPETRISRLPLESCTSRRPSSCVAPRPVNTSLPVASCRSVSSSRGALRAQANL
jgi:hypothetical protein